MKRIFAIIVVLVLAATVALVYYFVRSKPAPRAATFLPESTLAFIDIPNFPKSRDAFSQTELYALWHEPEVQAFLERPLTELHDASTNIGAPKDTETLSTLILGAIQGEAFLAITHVTIFPLFSPGVVMGVDVGAKRLETVAGLYNLEGRLQKAYPKGNYESREYLGVKYVVWETTPGFEVCHAFFNSLVVFTYGEDEMRDLIASWTGQVPKEHRRLADSAKFQNVERHATKDHELLAYFNVEEMLNLVGPLLALSPQTAGAYQKFSSIESSAYSLTFVDHGIEDVGFVGYANNAHKPIPPIERKTLALTTPQTLVYSVGSANLSSAYDELMQSLSQSGSTSMMSMAAHFQHGLQQRNVHLSEDVLQKLGPELACIVDWHTGVRSPKIAIVGEVTEAEKLRPALDAALDALKETIGGTNDTFQWDETESATQKLRSLHLGGRVPSPTYTVTDHFFILASNPDYARELLMQVNKPQPTLATSLTYQTAMKRLPTNASSYGYADLPALFTSAYGLMHSVLPQNSSNDLVDMNKLPRPETISKHLFPFVSATVSEAQQTITMSFSPLGKSLGAVLGIGGAMWAINTFQSQLPASITSVWPKKSSSKAAPSAPTENQTAGSQTPSTP